jgi:hypothetical protein
MRSAAFLRSYPLGLAARMALIQSTDSIRPPLLSAHRAILGAGGTGINRRTAVPVFSLDGFPRAKEEEKNGKARYLLTSRTPEGIMRRPRERI